MVTIWIDKAQKFRSMISSIIVLCVSFYLLFVGQIIAAIILLVFLGLCFLTQAHHGALTITDQGLLLGSARFPSIGRKLIFFKDIEEIRIDNCRFWDEKPGNIQQLKSYWVLRVKAQNADEYRAMLLRSSVESFKESLHGKVDRQVLKGMLR